MQTPIQIVFHGVGRSNALVDLIREKANRFQHFNARLARCHITLAQTHRQPNQPGRFSVCMVLHVPGEQIVVNRDEHRDASAALRDAFDSAKRLLEEAARRHRRELSMRSRHLRASSARSLAAE